MDNSDVGDFDYEKYSARSKRLSTLTYGWTYFLVEVCMLLTDYGHTGELLGYGCVYLLKRRKIED
jgi:hypothetical protein